MTFALTTADPVFDPRAPLTVNGFLFVPAQTIPSQAIGPTRLISEERLALEYSRAGIEGDL